MLDKIDAYNNIIFPIHSIDIIVSIEKGGKMKRRIVSIVLTLFILLTIKPLFADPTVLTRIIGGGVILFGLRPSGMGGATLALQTPATLWRLPVPALSMDFGYSTLSMRWAQGTDEAVLPLYGVGVAWPLPNRWAVAFRVLRMTTNDFKQQDNIFAPLGPPPFTAKSKDFALLTAISKGLGENFGLGLAFMLYGKSTYGITAADGNKRHYEALERFSPLVFFHWQLNPKIAIGGQVSFISAVQVYEGDDFASSGNMDVEGNPIQRFEANIAHYEYKLGFAYAPIKGLTIAVDGEYHFTDAPLHPMLGGHETTGGENIEAQFDSFRWYAGIEKSFSFGLPADILTLRAGLLDEKSPTAGLTLRLKLGNTPVQLDYAFVRNHSKKEFDEFEPGLFGESSNSHGLTLTVLLGSPQH